jgi:hypothetical protein
MVATELKKGEAMQMESSQFSVFINFTGNFCSLLNVLKGMTGCKLHDVAGSVTGCVFHQLMLELDWVEHAWEEQNMSLVNFYIMEPL